MSKYIKKAVGLTVEKDEISTFIPANINTQKKSEYTDSGVYESYSQQENNVDIVTSNSDLRLEFCTDSMIRIRAKGKSDEYKENENVMIVKYDWKQVDYTAEDTQEYLLLKTSALSVRIYKNPISIEYYEPDNQTPILKGSDMGYKADGSSRISFITDSGNTRESFFGLGISGSEFDYRNKSHTVWMSDKNKHYESPFFISTRKYGIYVHTSFESNFDFTTTPYTITTAGGELDYYFTYADTLKNVVSGYHELTGTLSMPPQKIMGLMYRGNLKNTEQQYKDIINAFRKRNVPLDYVGLEPGWQTASYPCTYAWNTQNFSNPKAFVEWTKAQNIDLNLWFHPYVHNDSPIREEIEPYLFDHKTSFATRNGGKAIDFTSSAAKEIFYNHFKTTLGDLGIYSFKIDEVDQFISSDSVLPSGISGAKYHNIFGIISQQVIHDGARSNYGLRTFTYDRGLFTGAQRYPSAAYSDTYDLTEYIRLNVNAGFTGGYFTPELRGDNEENENMYQRRLQLVAFSAYPQENEWQNGELPWNRSEKSFKNYKKYINLRYQLIPYIYTQFNIQSTTGEAFLKPLVLDFEYDTNTYNVDQQYMFGQSMMIAPVNSDKDVAKTPVYLPEGTDWYDYNTGLKYTGGQKIEYTSESDMLPIFIKSGSIIPMGEVKQYNTHGEFGNIILDVYGGADGSSYLYEDDGETFDYEKGEYAVTSYTTTVGPQKITLNISDRTGLYESKERTYTVKLHTQNAPTSVIIDGNPARFIYENGVSTVTFNDDTKAKVIEYQVDTQEKYNGDEGAVLWVDYDKNTEDDFTNVSEWNGSQIVKVKQGAEISGAVNKTFTVDVDKMPYIKVKVNSTTGNWKVKINGREILNKNINGLFAINYKGTSEKAKKSEVTLESNGKTTFELLKFTGFEKGYYFSSELETKYLNGKLVFNNPGVLIKNTTISTKMVIDSAQTPYLRVNFNGNITVRIDGKEMGTTSATRIFKLPEIGSHVCDVSVTASKEVILDSIELLSENDVKRESLKTNKSYINSTAGISTAVIKDGIKIYQTGRNPEICGGWDSVSKTYIVDLEKYNQLKLNITTMENTFYSVKMINKNGKEIQVKADSDVSFNGVIDLSSVSDFKDFMLSGQNEYAVYIWINDTRNTQEGFVTLSGLEFIKSSASKEYATGSGTE